MAKNPQCQTCKHYEKLPQPERLSHKFVHGICHRYPTKVKTPEHDMCALYEEKK